MDIESYRNGKELQTEKNLELHKVLTVLETKQKNFYDLVGQDGHFLLLTSIKDLIARTNGELRYIERRIAQLEFEAYKEAQGI